MNTRFAILLVLLMSANMHAHPGHGDDDVRWLTAARPWTLIAPANATTAEQTTRLHGTFVAVRDGAVQIRRDDGTLAALPVDGLSFTDQKWLASRQAELRRLNTAFLLPVAAPPAAEDAQPDAPAILQSFKPFDDKLKFRWDEKYFYVESDGMPDHRMMVGITAWQQQVPLPQPYTGNNAWQIPLKPMPAKEPMSAKTNFFRGAIALAVNGVPIFNPIKNDGKTDTFLAGELDEFGGHCGRGDDYHYHLPPVHLEKLVGKGKPIAWALDGYPILGYIDNDGHQTPLDALNGHQDADGNYHYHATKNYPYLNGGFYGEVVERGGQVDPQPRANGLRPALPPLRGARITGFTRTADGLSCTVEYMLAGQKHTGGYTITPGKSVRFMHDSGPGGPKTETTYSLDRKPGTRGGGGDKGSPAANEKPSAQGRPPRGQDGPPRGEAGKPEGDGGKPRLPWLTVHAAETDTNHDRILTRDEILAEARSAFDLYDAERTGRLKIDALLTGRPARSPMCGFIHQHAREIDRDDDGVIARDEVIANAGRMFDKSDRDGDGRIEITQDAPSAPKDRPAGLSPATPKATKGEPRKAEPRTSATGGDGGAASRPPNIVFILLDDMGWRDVGFAGNTFVETPNIDRLAREGVQFTQAYASAPNCAPTRACLMSGQYPPRHGVFTVVDPRHDPGQPHHKIIAAASKPSLDTGVVTIAEVLRDRGYATGGFGMWNLGRGRDGPETPTGQGFGVFKNPKDLGFAQNVYFREDGAQLTDVLTSEGLKFIEAYHDKPFFLYLPTHAVHSPLEPKPDLLAKYRRKAEATGDRDADPAYAALIETVDANVGRILSKLEELNLSRNTMVVFTSDNGGTPQYVAPLNGSKGALYEGGIRVPSAVWGAGIANPGRTSDEPILSMDFYPTLAEITGAPLPKDQVTDGVSLMPVLAGTGKIKRQAVYWHFPCYIGRGEPSSAIRQGDWKLIEKFEGPTVELYNLKDDPGERTNLATKEPEKAESLRAMLKTWQTQIGAPRPTEKNPNYDPSAVGNAKRRQPVGRAPDASGD